MLKKQIVNRTSSEVTSAHFKVTIKAPTGLTFANYPIKLNGTAQTITGGEYVFNSVEVAAKTSAEIGSYAGVTISGLPVGTTYKIEKLSADHPDGNENNVSGQIKAYSDSHKTTNATVTETVTNTYPKKSSLTLQKAFNSDSTATANGVADRNFTFEVVFTPQSASGANGMTLDTFQQVGNILTSPIGTYVLGLYVDTVFGSHIAKPVAERVAVAIVGIEKGSLSQALSTTHIENNITGRHIALGKEPGIGFFTIHAL